MVRQVDLKPNGRRTMRPAHVAQLLFLPIVPKRPGRGVLRRDGGPQEKAEHRAYIIDG